MPALGRLGDAAERSRLRANLTSVEGGQKLNSRVVLSWGDICYKLKTLGPYNFLHRLSTSITAWMCVVRAQMDNQGSEANWTHLVWHF